MTDREHVAIATEARTCDRHGDYTAVCWELQPTHPKCPAFWGQCPVCDAEISREAELRDAAIRGGLSPKERLKRQHAINAGIPARFADSTVWNWQHGMDQQRRVWDWCRDYCTQLDLALQYGRSCVMVGSPGTGKTHIAIGVLKHVLEKGGTGLYITVMDLLSRIKDTYNENTQETEARVIEHLNSVDLLVVDEVGRQLDTNYDKAQLFRVLNNRYANRKPVFVISNLNRPKLATFLGEAIVDRLGENGGKVLTFDWASQRNKRKPRQDDKEE